MEVGVGHGGEEGEGEEAVAGPVGVGEGVGRFGVFVGVVGVGVGGFEVDAGADVLFAEGGEEGVAGVFGGVEADDVQMVGVGVGVGGGA